MLVLIFSKTTFNHVNQYCEWGPIYPWATCIGWLGHLPTDRGSFIGLMIQIRPPDVSI